MKSRLILIAALLILVMTACGGSADPTTGETAGESIAVQALNEVASATTETTAEPTTDASTAIAEQIAAAEPVDSLSADYRDALPVESQLAFGTLQLESTEQAVTVEQAEALLPLWQALMALQASGTAADVELQAVVLQIQAGMTSQQLGAIAALELTEESIADLMESGALGFGRGPQGDGEGAGGGFAAGGGPPPGGLGGFGGGPGGGPGGGGPGGGIGIEGGFDPSAIETRQAEMAASGAGSLSQQMGPNMVVRLLQSKTGQFEPFGFVGFGQVMTAVSEATGLDVEAIQSAMAEGQTLGQIVEANGGDIDAVREAIITALEEMPQAEEQDLAAMADELLNSGFPQNPAP